MCGGDWSEHNSATGGYYRCNRYVPQADAGDAGGSGGAPWAFIGDFLGKIQVQAALHAVELEVIIVLAAQLPKGLQWQESGACSAVMLAVLRSRGALAGALWEDMLGEGCRCVQLWDGSTGGRSCRAETASEGTL